MDIMLSIDEIMADFRRNGRESDSFAMSGTADRESHWNDSLSWNTSCPSINIQFTKNESSDMTSSNKLAKALSNLSLCGPSEPSVHSPCCAHNGPHLEKFDYYKHVLSSEPIKNVLQCGSVLTPHEILLGIIHERAQQLKLETGSSNFRKSDNVLPHPLGFLSGETLQGKRFRETLSAMTSHRRSVPPTSEGRHRSQTWSKFGSTMAHSPPTFTRTAQPGNSGSAPICDGGRSCRHARTPRVGSGRIAQVPRRQKNTGEKGPNNVVPAQRQSSKVVPSAPAPPEPVIKNSKVVVEEKPSKPIPISKNKNGKIAVVEKAISKSTPAKDVTSLKSLSQSNETANRWIKSATSAVFRRRRHVSESQIQTQGGCVFCKKNGEMASVYSNHVAKDAQGRTVCKILQKYVCPLCEATGENAHTLKYCPQNVGKLFSKGKGAPAISDPCSK